MARSKKVRAYADLVKQRRTATRTLAKLEEKCFSAYNGLSYNEKVEYKALEDARIEKRNNGE